MTQNKSVVYLIDFNCCFNCFFNSCTKKVAIFEKLSPKFLRNYRVEEDYKDNYELSFSSSFPLILLEHLTMRICYLK